MVGRSCSITAHACHRPAKRQFLRSAKIANPVKVPKEKLTKVIAPPLDCNQDRMVLKPRGDLQ
jgi:hypothetical protein